MSIEACETVRDELLFYSFVICHDRFRDSPIRTILGYGDFLEPEQSPDSYPALVLDLRIERLLSGLELPRVISSALTIYDANRDVQSIVAVRDADPDLYDDAFSRPFVDALQSYRSHRDAGLLVAQVA